MWKQISYLKKNLIVAIPIFMVLGILYGNFFTPTPLKSLILPLTFLMVYPMMVNLKVKKLFLKGNSKLQIITQVINFGIIPFVAYFMGKIFFSNNPLIALGLLLAALLPKT